MTNLSNHKKILILDHAGHTSQFDLALSLSKKNFNTLFSYTKKLSTPNALFEENQYLKIYPIELSKNFNKYNYLLRILDEITLGIKQSRLISLHKPEIVQSANNPLISQLIIIFYCKIKKIIFINWITDLLGLGIYNTLKRKNIFLAYIVGNFFKKIEFICAKNSNWNITIAHTFEKYLREKGIKNINSVLNWAPYKEEDKKISHFFSNNGFHDKKVILFSGTLGKKHSINILFNIAKMIESYEDHLLVVITNPEIVDSLRIRSKSDKLDNIKFFPFQPASDIYQIFKNSYVLLNILNSDSNFSVPSKVLSYIVAAKPILLVMPEENEISQMVIKNNLGLVVDNKNIDQLKKNLDLILFDKILREKLIHNNKNYSKNYFQSYRKLEEFIEVYKKIGIEL
tara:strand:+ start:7412 stop:8608 length:1197 start_codon:yes stop_codon:yes gene_type:complete